MAGDDQTKTNWLTQTFTIPPTHSRNGEEVKPEKEYTMAEHLAFALQNCRGFSEVDVSSIYQDDKDESVEIQLSRDKNGFSGEIRDSERAQSIRVDSCNKVLHAETRVLSRRQATSETLSTSPRSQVLE